jgi:heat shock protein HslJ
MAAEREEAHPLHHREAMRYLSPLLVLLLAAACASDRDRDRDSDRRDRDERVSLEGPRWVLVEMNGDRVDCAIDLHFESDGRFHGSAGDQYYSGSWKNRRDDDLTLTSIDAPRRGDREDQTRQERRYLDKLERIERYALKRDRLELMPDDRDNSLVFERRGRNSWDRDRGRDGE